MILFFDNLKSFIIFAYIKELPAMLERRPYKTATRFDGLTFYISGQTGMPKTDQSRHNKKQFLIWH